MDESERLLRLLGGFLSRDASAVTADMVGEVTETCGVGAEEAWALLVAGCLGLDAAGEDRAFYQRFLRPSLRLLSAAPYRADPYAVSVRFPHAREGAWELKEMAYRPFEAFVCGDLRQTADGRVLPQIGCFAEEFRYPAALENGREWMTVTPNEIETMRAPLARARGRVLTFGLGLGYFAFMAARKPEVESVTVVEREEAILRLFQQRLLPQFACGEKIRLVRADAFDWAQTQLRPGQFDFAFTDLWHDVSDGLPLRRRMREILRRRAPLEAAYWIEDTLRWYEDDGLIRR